MEADIKDTKKQPKIHLFGALVLRTITKAKAAQTKSKPASPTRAK